MLPATTHISLLERLAGGQDGGAWGEFSDRYGPLLDGFCRRRGLQDADREDVKQDVLLSLSKALPGFRYDPAKGKFRSYLKTVTLHAIFRRSCQTRPAGGLQPDEAAWVGGSATDPEIENAWEAEWRQHHLRQAMRTVASEFNEADLAAFRRYAMEGADAKETADLLGLTVDQVYQAKSRVVRRLSGLIAAQVEDEG